MNKKRLKPGMSLVEVIIAMAMFASCTLAITMALAGALKYTARNQRRDSELTVQQTALEKDTAAGVAIYNGSLNSKKITYTQNGTQIKSIDNVTEYKAIKTAQNGEDFNFEMKTFSSTPLGSDVVVADKADNKYKITFINSSDYSADVKININSGEIYEGDIDNGGYRHSSNLYQRTVDNQNADQDTTNNLAPAGFAIGYRCPDVSTAQMTITVYSNNVTYTFSGSTVTSTIPNELSTQTDGELTLTLDSTGLKYEYK